MREMLAGPPPAGGPPPQAAEMQQIGQKLGVVGPALDLIMIAILFLMVFKPRRSVTGAGSVPEREPAPCLNGEPARRTMTACTPWSAASTTMSCAS